MKLIQKARAIQTALATASLFAATAAMAGDMTGATGPNIGAISQNVSNSMFGVASGFESFLYLLGVVFLVLFILAAWKYKKSDGRDGNMGLVVTYLVLSVAAMAAPSVMGSMKSTIFGSSNVTTVKAPTQNFVGN